MEAQKIEFMKDEERQLYGNITTCPSKLGPGIKVTIRLAIPLVANDGKSLDWMCNNFNITCKKIEPEP